MSPSDLTENVNRGSELLMPLTHITGLRIDEVNFLFCQISAIILAFFLRSCLNRSQATATTRHLFVTTLGFSIIAFMFGFSDLFNLVTFALLIYFFIRVFPENCFKICFFISFGCLSFHHINLLMYKNIDNYTLDVTATVMIMVQKFTSLAASIEDGTIPKSKMEKDKLGKTRQAQAIRLGGQNLKFLHFLSYIFNFMGILAGPHNYFNDYKEFIENDGDLKLAKNKKLWAKDSYKNNHVTVFKKAVSGWVCLYLAFFINDNFNVNLLGDQSYVNKTSSAYIFIHFFLAGLFVGRFKFYFAWLYADAVNNAAGFGYDQENDNWNLISNVNFWKVELAYSSREAIGNWNTQSVSWLRLIVYERLPNSYSPLLKTGAVFAMSSIWHGFYPSYYWFFSYGILMTAANRKLTNSIGKYINDDDNTSQMLKTFHRYIGMIGFHIIFNYISVSHLLLTFERCKVFYSRVYCFGHVLLILIMILPIQKWFKGQKKPALVEKKKN